MPIPGPRLPYATRAVGDLRPRDTKDLSYQAEIWTILGGIFGGLAVLLAVIFGVWQIRRSIKEERQREQEAQMRNKRWYKRLGRTLWPW